MDGVISGIGRFDADHVLPVFRSHVGHTLGFLNPWIPDDRARGAGLFDDYFAVPNRVGDYAIGLSVQVHPIGFLGDARGWFPSFLCLNPSVLSMNVVTASPETEA